MLIGAGRSATPSKPKLNATRTSIVIDLLIRHLCALFYTVSHKGQSLLRNIPPRNDMIEGGLTVCHLT